MSTYTDASPALSHLRPKSERSPVGLFRFLPAAPSRNRRRRFPRRRRAVFHVKSPITRGGNFHPPRTTRVLISYGLGGIDGVAFLSAPSALNARGCQMALLSHVICMIASGDPSTGPSAHTHKCPISQRSITRPPFFRGMNINGGGAAAPFCFRLLGKAPKRGGWGRLMWSLSYLVCFCCNFFKISWVEEYLIR